MYGRGLDLQSLTLTRKQCFARCTADQFPHQTQTQQNSAGRTDRGKRCALHLKQVFSMKLQKTYYVMIYIVIKMWNYPHCDTIFSLPVSPMSPDVLTCTDTQNSPAKWCKYNHMKNCDNYMRIWCFQWSRRHFFIYIIYVYMLLLHLIKINLAFACCYKPLTFIICPTYKQTTITGSQYCCSFWQPQLIQASSNPLSVFEHLLLTLLCFPHSISLYYVSKHSPPLLTVIPASSPLLADKLLLVGVVAELWGAEYRRTALTCCASE